MNKRMEQPLSTLQGNRKKAIEEGDRNKNMKRLERIYD